MYRLMVVDDEAFIVDGICHYLSRQDEFELDIDKAYSSSEAMEHLKRIDFDIVLLDIQMPGPTGIDMLAAIKRCWPLCRVLFITGYKEFDFAVTAMKQGATDYILKTDGYDAIAAGVRKAIREIEEDMTSGRLMETAREMLRRSAVALQREYLSNIVYGGLAPDAGAFREIDIPLDPSRPVCLLMGVIARRPGNPYLHSQVGYALTGMIRQTLGDRVVCVFADLDARNFLWLLQPSRALGDMVDRPYERLVVYVKSLLEKITLLCRNAYECEPSFVLGGRAVEWAEINAGCEALMREGIPYLWSSAPFVMSAGPDVRGAAADRAASLEIKKMELYLENGDYARFTEAFDGATAPIRQIKSFRHAGALELYAGIALMLLSFINRLGLQFDMGEMADPLSLFIPQEHGSWETAVSHLKKTADAIYDNMRRRAAERAQEVVNTLKEYIEGHYAEGLSLARLSDMLHFNPCYLTRVFKQHTGVTIIRYATALRMQKARELLADTGLRINRVAELTGYETASYFTNAFKKECGVSPQEYRDAISGNDVK